MIQDEPGFLETAVLLIPPGVKFPDDAEELLGPDIIRFLAPETGRTVLTLH